MAKKSDFVIIPEDGVVQRNEMVIMSVKTYQKLLLRTLPRVSAQEQSDIEKRYGKPSRRSTKSYSADI